MQHVLEHDGMRIEGVIEAADDGDLDGSDAGHFELVHRVENVVLEVRGHRPVGCEVGAVARVVHVALHDHPVVADALRRREVHRLGAFAGGGRGAERAGGHFVAD